MIAHCLTTQTILALAASAARLGEPACETEISGVRVTVHAKQFSAPTDRSPHQKKTVLDGLQAPRASEEKAGLTMSGMRTRSSKRRNLL
jgi:hypothetical protein